jgi:hypothetical protein
MRALIQFIALISIAQITASTVQGAVGIEASQTVQGCHAVGGTWDRSRRFPNGYCNADTQDKCSARGGTWRRVCLEQKLYCVMPLPDAGRPCTDSKQCIRGCVFIGEEPVQRDAAVVGQCRATDNPCGCFILVENGRLGPSGCAD